MQIQLDDSQLKSIITESIFLSLTEEKKASLLKESIQFLLTPAKGPYSNESISPLQRAYNQAINDVCREQVKEMLQNSSELKEQIKDLVIKSFQKCIAEKEDLISTISENIAYMMKLDKNR